MDNKYLESLNRALETPSSGSGAYLTELMDETLAFVQEIQTKLASGNPAEKEEALQQVMEMKKVLASKAEALCEKTGLSPSELTALTQNPDCFSAQEKTAIATIQEKLAKFQNNSTPSRNHSLKKIKTKLL